jgi:hypothetical protein
MLASHSATNTAGEGLSCNGAAQCKPVPSPPGHRLLVTTRSPGRVQTGRTGQFKCPALTLGRAVARYFGLAGLARSRAAGNKRLSLLSSLAARLIMFIRNST